MKENTFIKIIDGKAVTDLTKKENLVVMTDEQAKIYNEHNKDGIELIKVKISLDRLEF